MKLPLMILATALLGTAYLARAEELTVWGTSLGEVHGVPQLAFHGHGFTTTTERGVGYFRGTNSLGIFSLAAIGQQVSGTFTLQLSLTAPTGLRGSPALAKQTAITARITRDDGCGGVWIHFSGPSSRVIFDTGSVNGSFTISLADVTVKPGLPTPLIAVLQGAQQSDVACPMEFSAAMARPVLLEPATGKMKEVWIRTAASDNPGCGLSCKIVSVSSNEPQSPDGDWQLTGDLSLNLRASREPSGYGRIYSVAVQCSDKTGLQVTHIAPVAVPRPKAKKTEEK